MNQLMDFGKEFVKTIKTAASEELQDTKQEAVNAGEKLLDHGLKKLTVIAVMAVGGMLILQGMILILTLWLHVETAYVTLAFGAVAFTIGQILKVRKDAQIIRS